MAPPTRHTKIASSPNSGKLSEESQTIISELNNRFTELSNSFSVLRTHFESILAKKEEEIQLLKTKTHDLEKRVLKLENSLDDEDAYIRRDTLIFSGTSVPEATNGEICKNIVKRIIEEKLKLKLSDADISVAHRLGKKPTSQAPDRRQITAKFCRRDIKRDILFAKKNISNRSESSSLFINESLTPRRRSIFYSLRQMKKAHPTIISGCSTIEGKVCVYTRNPSDNLNSSEHHRTKKHVINTQESLHQFCQQYIKEPMEKFLSTWEN